MTSYTTTVNNNVCLDTWLQDRDEAFSYFRLSSINISFTTRRGIFLVSPITRALVLGY